MWLFGRKTNRIVITFTKAKDGRVKTELKMDKDINAVIASQALDRVKAKISWALNKRVNGAQYSKEDPQKRVFIKKQTLGDIL